MAHLGALATQNTHAEDDHCKSEQRPRPMIKARGKQGDTVGRCSSGMACLGVGRPVLVWECLHTGPNKQAERTASTDAGDDNEEEEVAACERAQGPAQAN